MCTDSELSCERFESWAVQVGYWRSVAIGGYFHRSEFGTEDGCTVVLAGGHPSGQQHYNQKVSAKLLQWQTPDLNECVLT
jgi:hypothetical protein